MIRTYHCETYAMPPDTPEDVICILEERLRQKYEDVVAYEGEAYKYVTGANRIEEGNNEGQIVRDTDSTNGDDQGDPGANGADGYLGLVDDTGRDPV